MKKNNNDPKNKQNKNEATAAVKAADAVSEKNKKASPEAEETIEAPAEADAVTEAGDEAVTEFPESDSMDEAEGDAVCENGEDVETAVNSHVPPLELFKKYGPIAWKVITCIAAAVIFIYVFASVSGYIREGYRSEFHSDCTDTILWANASVESGSVYDKDFTYACFLPFGTNVLMQPLIKWFGYGMKAQVWGMMSFFIVLTIFLLLMLREAHFGLRGRLIGCSVFLSMTLSSKKLREIFWQHTIYYSLGILFIIIGLFLYFRFMNLAEKRKALPKDDKKQKILLARTISVFVILSAFIMLTATDGISALSIFAVPFIAAVFADWFMDTESKFFSLRSLNRVVSVGIFGLMILLGGKLNSSWVGDMKAPYQDANSEYSGMDTWLDHIHAFPLEWLRLNGVVDMDGKPLAKDEGFTNLFYIAAAVLLLVIPIIATLYYPKMKRSKNAAMLRASIWIHWVSSAIVMLGYICGILAIANWRLTPMIGTSLIVSILFVHWGITNKCSGGRLALLLFIPMIAVARYNFDTLDELRYEKDYRKENNLYGLADYLEEQHLDYGYATFWNANSITLISDSDVKVRDVTVNEYGVSKRIYQSSYKWYDAQPEQEKYFLLLEWHEADTLRNNGSPLFDQAMMTLTPYINDREYTVLVFDHNIF